MSSNHEEETPLLNNVDDVITPKKKQRSKPSTPVGLFMIFCGVLITLCTAGVIFGFGALKEPLAESGAYAWLCEEGEKRCKAQTLAIEVMFYVASLVINMAALPVGFILDKCGPRITSMLGTMYEAIGLLLLAFSCEKFPAYVPGYTCLALGGLHMFLAHIDMINIFPRYVGTVNGVLTGAFDSSSMIPVIWKMIFAKGAALSSIFLGYLVVPIGNAIYGLIFLRETQIPLHEEKAVKEETEALLDDDEEEDVSQKARVQYYNLFEKDMKGQIFSWEFLLVACFICISMLRLNFFIQTMDRQMAGLGFDEEQSKSLKSAFDLILPIGGIVSVAPVSFVLDFGGIVASFVSLEIAFLIFSILNLIPNATCQYISFCVFVLARTCLYASVTDFSGRMFGFANFGTIYGLIMTLSACVSFVQFPLSQLVFTLHGDFKLVNLCLSGVQLIGLLLPIFVYIKNNRIEAEAAAQHVEVHHPPRRKHSVNSFGSGVVYS